MALYKKTDDPALEMPDVENEYAASYLIGLLHEAGLMLHSGMGPVPLSWTEISNWLATTEYSLTLWDRLMVKRLSEEYVAELSQATDINRPAPYKKVVNLDEEEDLQRQRDIVQTKALSFFASRRKQISSDSNEESQV